MYLSRFNIIHKEKDKVYIYNTLNRAIIELDKKEYATILRDVKKGTDSELTNSLKAQDFIIDKDDELEIMEFNYKNMQFDTTSLSLTICPTMDCIFRCPYCFESRESGLMTPENQEKLIEYVKERIKTAKAMNVLWFGGEPLMGWDIVVKLSKEFIKLCKEYNIPYYAYMITNGYLLDDKKAKMFEDLKIEGIQITIDGPKRTHDTRRVLEGNVGTYDVITKNIENLKKYKINITIRVNIDKTNENDIEELFQDFHNRNFDHVSFSLGHVLSYTENCKGIDCNCLTKPEYSAKINMYNEILKKYNFPKNHKHEIPTPISIYCEAVAMHSCSIDHNLNMYKCWNDIGNKSKSIGKLGSTDRTEAQRAVERKYLLWNPFAQKECKKCKYLPLCFGGCPFMGMKISSHQCDHWKYRVKRIIKDYIENENK